MTAQIDVLIPVYNAAETLDSSLESISKQTVADFRAICIDDGSTDATPELLSAWSVRDSRFIVLTKPNGGIVDALNFGLGVVNAPLLARMDADDISLPTRFFEQRKYLMQHMDCVAVGGRVQHIDGKGSLLSGYPQPGPPEEADMYGVPAREPYIVHPFLMTRSEIVRAVGGYRCVPHSEDSDLFWRLAEHGRLHNLDVRLGQYRMHTASVSGQSVLNGRIMAVGSQLGALSARRRKASSPDLQFPHALVEELRAAVTLQAMCEQIVAMYDLSEVALFELSVGVKLLELAAYRPYEIEMSDCEFIGERLKHAASTARPGDLRDISWHVSRAGSRLLRQGRVAAAAKLVPRRAYIKTLARSVISS